eukprot:11167377-Lingulodinium_polyedra.AAC.1
MVRSTSANAAQGRTSSPAPWRRHAPAAAQLAMACSASPLSTPDAMAHCRARSSSTQALESIA